jgi:hypothetical protein
MDVIQNATIRLLRWTRRELRSSLYSMLDKALIIFMHGHQSTNIPFGKDSSSLLSGVTESGLSNALSIWA